MFLIVIPLHLLWHRKWVILLESKLSPTIGDVGYVFRKEFVQGWFTGIVVKIMKDGDR
jgi:hypothetical protein